MTNGLEQYHKLAGEQEGLVNANCLAHARRHFANAIKAMGSGNAETVKASVAYKTLVRIGAIYDLEGTLKGLTPEERLKERQSSIKPWVEEYFAWIKEVFRQGLVLAKSETAKGLAYSINQEEYLERKLKNKYTITQIRSTLQEMDFVRHEGKGYQPVYTRTELTDALHEAFGFCTSKQIVPTKKMKNICSLTKK